MDSEYLTVPQVAAELGISPDGVYKLIRRKKLPAIRRSERGMRVTRLALDAYVRRLRGLPEPEIEPPMYHAPMTALTLGSSEEFERETGMSPEEWHRQWKRDSIEDTHENMLRTITALRLLASKSSEKQPTAASALR